MKIRQSKMGHDSQIAKKIGSKRTSLILINWYTTKTNIHMAKSIETDKCIFWMMNSWSHHKKIRHSNLKIQMHQKTKQMKKALILKTFSQILT